MEVLILAIGFVVFAVWLIAKVGSTMAPRGGGQRLSDVSPEEIARRRRVAQAPQDPRKVKRKRYKSDYSNWRTVMAREGKSCHICGDPVDPEDWSRGPKGGLITGPMYPSVDHVKPKSQGGSHHYTNLKLAHKGCNSKKGAKHQ